MTWQRDGLNYSEIDAEAPPVATPTRRHWRGWRYWVARLTGLRRARLRRIRLVRYWWSLCELEALLEDQQSSSDGMRRLRAINDLYRVRVEKTRVRWEMEMSR